MGAVERLLEAGANVEAVNRNGRNAIEVAALAGHRDVARDVLRHLISRDGENAGHRIPIAVVFLEEGACLVDPAYRWFGAPHQEVVVLSDLETIGHQLAARVGPGNPGPGGSETTAQYDLGSTPARLRSPRCQSPRGGSKDSG